MKGWMEMVVAMMAAMDECVCGGGSGGEEEGEAAESL